MPELSKTVQQIVGVGFLWGATCYLHRAGLNVLASIGLFLAVVSTLGLISNAWRD